MLFSHWQFISKHFKKGNAGEERISLTHSVLFSFHCHGQWMISQFVHLRCLWRNVDCFRSAPVLPVNDWTQVPGQIRMVGQLEILHLLLSNTGGEVVDFLGRWHTNTRSSQCQLQGFSTFDLTLDILQTILLIAMLVTFTLKTSRCKSKILQEIN